MYVSDISFNIVEHTIVTKFQQISYSNIYINRRIKLMAPASWNIYTTFTIIEIAKRIFLFLFSDNICLNEVEINRSNKVIELTTLLELF